jgi:hypothetical protein
MKVVFYPNYDSIQDILEAFPELKGAKFASYGVSGVLQESVAVEAGTQCWVIIPHKEGDYKKASLSQVGMDLH